MPIISDPSSGCDPRPLLFSPNLASSEVARLLGPYGFHDWKQADANLQLMAGDPRSRKLLAVILPDLLHAVSVTADPDQALREWERYLDAGNARAQVFGFLAQVPHVLQLLCVLFGNSPAMAGNAHSKPHADLLDRGRPYPEISPHFQTPFKLSYTRPLISCKLMNASSMPFDAFIAAKCSASVRGDLFRVASVEETVQSLSRLAEIVIHAAYRLVNEELCKQYGIPLYRGPGLRRIETGFVVLGMGKLGGRELNYSSDVDLIYLYLVGRQADEDPKKANQQ